MELLIINEGEEGLFGGRILGGGGGGRFLEKGCVRGGGGGGCQLFPVFAMPEAATFLACQADSEWIRNHAFMEDPSPCPRLSPGKIACRFGVVLEIEFLVIVCARWNLLQQPKTTVRY